MPPDILELFRTPIADAVRAEVQAAVEAGIRKALVGPVAEAIRRAMLPPFLTRQQLAELTGWSIRKIDYLKAERRIPL